MAGGGAVRACVQQRAVEPSWFEPGWDTGINERVYRKV